MAFLNLQNMALLGWISGHELLIVAVVFLVLFGGARLPGLMRNMGRSINEFKAGMKDKPSENDYDAQNKNVEDQSDDEQS